MYALQHGSLFVTSFVFLMGLLFKVNGVSSASPTYAALAVIMLLACAAFLVAWVVVAVLGFWTNVRAQRRNGRPLLTDGVQRDDGTMVYTRTRAPAVGGDGPDKAAVAGRGRSRHHASSDGADNGGGGAAVGMDASRAAGGRSAVTPASGSDSVDAAMGEQRRSGGGESDAKSGLGDGVGDVKFVVTNPLRGAHQGRTAGAFTAPPAKAPLVGGAEGASVSSGVGGTTFPGLVPSGDEAGATTALSPSSDARHHNVVAATYQQPGGARRFLSMATRRTSTK